MILRNKLSCIIFSFDVYFKTKYCNILKKKRINFHAVCIKMCSFPNTYRLVGWLRLNVPVNNFSVMSGRSHRFLGN